ncbi:eCIS core domain-containing protein [Actinophytocola glycyrrhizae]|uniref:DUF4157 domain-containing protein n=1 Tax=Actinophytocola glycyrrhizae TaxID=2044873 RepID=A0ABV9S1U8_9PSEU
MKWWPWRRRERPTAAAPGQREPARRVEEWRSLPPLPATLSESAPLTIPVSGSSVLDRLTLPAPTLSRRGDQVDQVHGLVTALSDDGRAATHHDWAPLPVRRRAPRPATPGDGADWLWDDGTGAAAPVPSEDVPAVPADLVAPVPAVDTEPRVLPARAGSVPESPLTVAAPLWVAPPVVPAEPWTPSEFMHRAYLEKDRLLAEAYRETNGESQPRPQPVAAQEEHADDGRMDASFAPPAATPSVHEPSFPAPSVPGPEPRSPAPPARRASLAQARRQGLTPRSAPATTPAPTDDPGDPRGPGEGDAPAADVPGREAGALARPDAREPQDRAMPDAPVGMTPNHAVPRLEPAARPQARPELEPRPRSVPEREPLPEPEVVPRSELGRELARVPEVDAVSEREPRPEPEAVRPPEFERVRESEAVRSAEFERVREPEAVLRPELEPEPEAVLRPELEPEPEAVRSPELERVREPEAVLRPELEPEPEAVRSPELERVWEPGAVLRPELEREPEVGAASERESRPEPVPGVVPEAALSGVVPGAGGSDGGVSGVVVPGVVVPTGEVPGLVAPVNVVPGRMASHETVRGGEAPRSAERTGAATGDVRPDGDGRDESVVAREGAPRLVVPRPQIRSTPAAGLAASRDVPHPAVSAPGVPVGAVPVPPPAGPVTVPPPSPSDATTPPPEGDVPSGASQADTEVYGGVRTRGARAVAFAPYPDARYPVTQDVVVRRLAPAGDAPRTGRRAAGGSAVLSHVPSSRAQFAMGDGPSGSSSTSDGRGTVEESPPLSVVRPVSLALGVDVSDVTVRRGPDVTAMSHRLGARGYTDDRVVYLPDDVGPLDSSSAAPLLAHELTHAAQQRDFGAALPAPGSVAGQQLEDDAVEIERWVAGGAGGSPPALVHPVGGAKQQVGDAIGTPVSGRRHSMAEALAMYKDSASNRPVLDVASLFGPVEPGGGAGTGGDGPDGGGYQPVGWTGADEEIVPATAIGGTVSGGTATGRRHSMAEALAMYKDSASNRPVLDVASLFGPDEPGDDGDGPGGDATGGGNRPGGGPADGTVAALAEGIAEIFADEPPRRWFDLDDVDDFEELAGRIYNELVSRIRFDMVVDRERSGTLLDFG